MLLNKYAAAILEDLFCAPGLYVMQNATATTTTGYKIATCMYATIGKDAIYSKTAYRLLFRMKLRVLNHTPG